MWSRQAGRGIVKDGVHIVSIHIVQDEKTSRRAIDPVGADDLVIRIVDLLNRDDAASFVPSYSPWRHGGWYVDNVRYPGGAVGCVSRNYPDGKWRIVCDARAGEHTYATRDDAARAEFALTQTLRGSQ